MSERESTANYFKKGTEPCWSDKLYTVEGVKGRNIKLNHVKVYKQDKLLKTSNGTIKIIDESVKPNLTMQANKKRKLEILHNQVGVDEAHIVTINREQEAGIF